MFIGLHPRLVQTLDDDHGMSTVKTGPEISRPSAEETGTDSGW